MKKTAALLLALAIIMTLSGCFAPRPVEPVQGPSQETAETPAETPSETPEPVEDVTVTPAEEELPGYEEPDVPAGEQVDVSISSLPDSLKSFLLQFAGWYRDLEGRTGKVFDCNNASDGSSNIMMNIVANGSCVDFDQYLGVSPVYHWNDGTADPRNWCEEYGAYAVFDGATVDWIAENVFNITQKDIEELVEQSEKAGKFYKGVDGNGSYCYYTPVGGVGDPFIDIEFTKATFDGTKYYIDYDLYNDCGDGTREYADTYYTVVELKKMDGSVFWSMYSHLSLNEI